MYILKRFKNALDCIKNEKHRKQEKKREIKSIKMIIRIIWKHTGFIKGHQCGIN